MRRIFRQRATPDDLTRLFAERKPKVRRPLSDLRTVDIALSVVVGIGIIGVAAFALLAWLAWDTHEFGEKDLRYLLFARGTLIERIGTIDERPGTLVYRGRRRDGTAPPFLQLSYASSRDANELFDRFVARCKVLGLEVKPGEPRSSDASRMLGCGVAGKDDFQVQVSIGSTMPTEVSMSEDIDDGL